MQTTNQKNQKAGNGLRWTYYDIKKSPNYLLVDLYPLGTSDFWKQFLPFILILILIIVCVVLFLNVYL